MTNGGTEWRSQGGDGGGKPWCIGKGAPYRRVAMLPAWPTAGGTGSKWPASQWTMRLWATSQRHEGKRFRQLQHHEHRAQSTYLVHSSWGGTGLEEGKEGRRGGGGRGRKKERDKVRIPNAMQSSLNSWGEAGEGASTQTQEHATRTQMQGRPPRVIGFKDSLLFAELLWATSWELLLHHCPRQYAGFEINLLKMRSLGKETPDARQSGFLSFKLLLIVIHGHCRKFRKEQRKKSVVISPSRDYHPTFPPLDIVQQSFLQRLNHIEHTKWVPAFKSWLDNLNLFSPPALSSPSDNYTPSLQPSSTTTFS